MNRRSGVILAGTSHLPGLLVTTFGVDTERYQVEVVPAAVTLLADPEAQVDVDEMPAVLEPQSRPSGIGGGSDEYPSAGDVPPVPAKGADFAVAGGGGRRWHSHTHDCTQLVICRRRPGERPRTGKAPYPTGKPVVDTPLDTPRAEQVVERIGYIHALILPAGRTSG